MWVCCLTFESRCVDIWGGFFRVDKRADVHGRKDYIMEKELLFLNLQRFAENEQG